VTIQVRLELCHVTPQPRAIHTQLLFTPPDQDVTAQFVTERVYRLPQRVARVCLVEVRPEECEEGVPAVKSARPGCGEVRQEREALGPAQNGGDVATGVQQIQRSQQLQLEHLTAT